MSVMHQSTPSGRVADLAQTLFVQSDMVIKLWDHVQCVFGHIGLWGKPVLVGGRRSDPGVTYCRISFGASASALRGVNVSGHVAKGRHNLKNYC